MKWVIDVYTIVRSSLCIIYRWGLFSKCSAYVFVLLSESYGFAFHSLCTKSDSCPNSDPWSEPFGYCSERCSTVIPFWECVFVFFCAHLLSLFLWQNSTLLLLMSRMAGTMSGFVLMDSIRVVKGTSRVSCATISFIDTIEENGWGEIKVKTSRECDNKMQALCAG